MREDWELPSYIGFSLLIGGMFGGWVFKKSDETGSKWAVRELALRKQEAKAAKAASNGSSESH